MTELIRSKEKSSLPELFGMHMAGDPNLGAIIRNARKARGMTQQHVSERIGVAKAAVSQWEAGKHHIKDDNRRALAALLGIPLEIMFRVSGERSQLSEAEWSLIERFRRLSPDRQKAVQLILASYFPDEPTE